MVGRAYALYSSSSKGTPNEPDATARFSSTQAQVKHEMLSICASDKAELQQENNLVFPTAPNALVQKNMQSSIGAVLSRVRSTE